jgi:hypothetical protein
VPSRKNGTPLEVVCTSKVGLDSTFTEVSVYELEVQCLCDFRHHSENRLSVVAVREAYDIRLENFAES